MRYQTLNLISDTLWFDSFPSLLIVTVVTFWDPKVLKNCRNTHARALSFEDCIFGFSVPIFMLHQMILKSMLWAYLDTLSCQIRLKLLASTVHAQVFIMMILKQKRKITITFS
jgi:hypothetical protein